MMTDDMQRCGIHRQSPIKRQALESIAITACHATQAGGVGDQVAQCNRPASIFIDLALGDLGQVAIRRSTTLANTSY